MTNGGRYKIDRDKVLFADECFKISGVCFYVQNKLGRFAREKQYCDLVTEQLTAELIDYHREFVVGDTGNRVDFIIFNKILLEIKAKPFLTQDDYAQVQRYLQVLDLDLGLLVNFWSRSALPHRILRQKNS